MSKYRLRQKQTVGAYILQEILQAIDIFADERK